MSLHSLQSRETGRTGAILAGLLNLLAVAAAPAEDLFLPVGPAVGQVPSMVAAASAAVESEDLGPTFRYRHARIDVGLLGQARAAAELGDAPTGLIDLNLFDDASFRVAGLRTAPTSAGYSISGELEGEPLSSMTVVVNGGVIAGEVRLPDATYTIRSVGDVVEIRQTDEEALPECAETEPPQALAGAAAGARDLPTFDLQASTEVTEVDVLVVYTTAAKDAAGGVAAMEARIDLFVAATNGYLEASGVKLRVRLAHAEELDHAETSSSFELIPLRERDEGLMDEVHALRDAAGADMVHLIERWGVRGTSSYCGIAYVMENVGAEFEGFAFGSTVLSCGSSTFAHELGHNMGLRHDRYAHDLSLDSGLNNKPYAHAYGYVNQVAFASGAPSSKRWRTIMAYSSQCSHSGFGCARVGRFSSPAQKYSGDPLGVWRNGVASAVTGPADAVSTLNETRTTVAAWRSPAPAPQVVSLKRRTPAEELTKSDSLAWRLAFSRDVEHVTSDDFELSGSGLGTTTLTVTAKSGSQRLYDLAVTSGVDSFDGEVTLGFASSQDIESLSAVGLVATWPAHAERTYTLDNTGPTPSISPSSAGSSPFVATITFGEDVTGFSDAGDITATNATVSAPSRSDARTYTVQVTPVGSTATTITLSARAAAATDLAANDSVAVSQDVAWDPSTASTLTVSGYSGGSVTENSQWTSATPTTGGNPSGTVSWTKEGDDADLFTIDSATGVLGLPGQNFEEPADADDDGEYEVTARASDTKGNSAAAAVTVSVTGAVESKSVLVSGALSRKIPDGSRYASTPFLECRSGCWPEGLAIDPVTWTKTGVDEALFTLNSARGALFLGTRDFEMPEDADRDNRYLLTVKGTDADGNTASKNVTVQVIKGPPRWLSISGVADGTVEEGDAWTSATPSASGTTGSVTWTTEGPDAAQFSVGSAGVLTMVAQDYENPADADEDNVYEVYLRATDERRNSGTAPISVTVLEMNHPPAALGSLPGVSLQVGDGARQVDVSGAFEDPEMDALSYDASSSTPGVAQVRISGSQAVLTPVARGDATITVTATDVAGSNTPAEQRFNVRVKGRRGVTLSRDAVSVDEGSTNTYTVVLDSEPTGDVTVTPVVPANRNLSVDPTEVEFTMGDWQSPKTVTVEAATDTNTNSESPVTITHQVRGADYGSVTAASLRVTIVETDTSVLSVEAVEVSEGGGEARFEVSLSRENTSEITVDYATSNVSAQAGSDYTASSGTLTFPASSTASQEIAVDVTDDDVDEEEEETFRLTLRNARHAALAGGGSTLQVLGTIQDDDDPEVEVLFGSASYSVTEGVTTTVSVRLDRDPERDLEIFLERTHRGGTEDADYSGVPSSVAFGPGVRNQDFQVAATDDTTDDDGESVVLSFVSLPFRVSGDGETTIAIQDNDGTVTPAPGGPGGGGPPPDDDDDDDGGAGGGPPPPSGPPEAYFTPAAECAGDLCLARTGLTVTFEDSSTGRVVSRLWDFGDGTTSRSRRVVHTWSSPGFYEVTLTVSDGTTTSVASEVFRVEAADPAGTCEPDAGTLCLQDSRYAVTVEWRVGNGASGSASVVHRGTNDSGMFWFFDWENWEVLIKVLDGCALNGQVWVFGASTTDLGYLIRVTDTVTGAVKEYRNEPGLPAPAITDATAFPRGCGRP